MVSIEYNFEILWYPQVDCFSHISLELVLNVLADLISLKINARGSRSPGERRCLCPAMFVQSSHVTAIVFGVSIISVFTLANPHQRTPPTPIHVKATLPTSGNCGLVSEAGVASPDFSRRK